MNGDDDDDDEEEMAADSGAPTTQHPLKHAICCNHLHCKWCPLEFILQHQGPCSVTVLITFHMLPY